MIISLMSPVSFSNIFNKFFWLIPLSPSNKPASLKYRLKDCQFHCNWHSFHSLVMMRTNCFSSEIQFNASFILLIIFSFSSFRFCFSNFFSSSVKSFSLFFNVSSSASFHQFFSEDSNSDSFSFSFLMRSFFSFISERSSLFEGFLSIFVVSSVMIVVRVCISVSIFFTVSILSWYSLSMIVFVNS